MGWFDDQIKQRKLRDDEVFSDSFVEMAGAIIGNRAYEKLSDSSINVKDSIDEIMKYYHIKSVEVPEIIKDVNEQLEYVMRPYGIMRRTVKLEKEWYKDAIGAMLTVMKEDDSVVALIPNALSGYSYYDVKTGKHIKINKFNADLFDQEAIAFYKPFPQKKLKMSDLVAYMASMVSVSDVVLIVLATLAVTLVGKLIPKLNNILFGNVVDQNSLSLLMAVSVFLICVTISNLLISAIKTMFTSRLNTKLGLSVQAATMMRVLSLPAGFFKQFSSGDLSSRIGNVSTLCEMLITSVFQTGITTVLSLVYLGSIYEFASELVVPSIIIIIVTTVFSLVSTLAKLGIVRKQMKVSAKVSGISYALISGVQKVKLSGSEKRAFARWGNLYAQEAQLRYNPNLFVKINGAISTCITLAGTIVLYYEAIRSGISAANYFAFQAAYGMVSGAFLGAVSIAQSAAQIQPIMEMVEPILDAVPEISEDKAVVTRLSGMIEFDNVCFKYSESQPLIVNDMSFKIHSGEYIAIVGKTGCGKSTIVRLLLGFEKAQSGGIYYDGKDINSMDLKSLRRHIGVVMQEGKLFQGDIFSNITISAPWLTQDDAWEAAEMAGIAEDIRRMPMGMFTIISEGSGGISGGQRQRLMIARAIAPKPKILIFDEATSALDNITQKKVSESLDSLNCTRIVIAHRLSTIKHCDRILCLDGGRIIEDGTYDELLAKKGFFAELVERQRIDTNISSSEATDV